MFPPKKLLHRHAKEQTILCSRSKGMYLVVGVGIYKWSTIQNDGDCLHLPIHITIWGVKDYQEGHPSFYTSITEMRNIWDVPSSEYKEKIARGVVLNGVKVFDSELAKLSTYCQKLIFWIHRIWSYKKHWDFSTIKALCEFSKKHKFSPLIS